MNASGSPEVLDTTGGEFLLRDYRLRGAGHEWAVWHTGAVLTDVSHKSRSGGCALRPALDAM